MSRVPSATPVIPYERLEAHRARRCEAAAKRNYGKKQAAVSGGAYVLPHEDELDYAKAAAFIEFSESIDLMLARAEKRLRPDEDDEALADDYPIPTDHAKSTARLIAERIVREAARKSGAHVLPRFEAAGDGGVGLHWKRLRIELLISVPPSLEDPILYYGDTPSGISIKGSLLPDSPAGFLAEWIVEHELRS